MTDKPPSRPVGRPTKYEGEKTCKQAEKLCLLGADDKKLADFFEVDPDTIAEWKNVYPEFSESVSKGKLEYDNDNVEKAVLKRALGFMRRVERVSKDGIVECLEEVPPDPVSFKFWLTNRRREYWKDKQDIEHSGNVQVAPVINFLLPEKK